MERAAKRKLSADLNRDTTVEDRETLAERAAATGELSESSLPPDTLALWREVAADPRRRRQLARESLMFFCWYYLRARGKRVSVPRCHREWYKAIGTGKNYRKASKQRKMLLLAPRSHGKCLKVGTEAVMFDGSLRRVEDIVEGDLLMGPDSKPRRVLSTIRGTGRMLRIVPSKGDAWECNDEHILTVEEKGSCPPPKEGQRKRAKTAWAAPMGQRVIKDIPIKEWMSKSKWFHGRHKQFSVGVEFQPQAPLPIAPYFLGVWLGDGDKALSVGTGRVAITTMDPEIVDALRKEAAKHGLVVKEGNDRHLPDGRVSRDRCYRFIKKKFTDLPSEERPTRKERVGHRGTNQLLEKFRALLGTDCQIPRCYLTSSRQERLEFLAGWVDTDGSEAQGSYEITQKRKDYADAIAFVARSLGYRATLAPKVVDGSTYWRIGIHGQVWEIPVRIARKKILPRKKACDTTRTTFKVEEAGEGEYAGFMLEGDGRFLLSDFTVTHNSHVSCWVVPLHRICFNRNVRILILGASMDAATKWLRRIRVQLETNKRIIEDFAKVDLGEGLTSTDFRDKSAPWTDHRIQVQRGDQSLADATIEAAGAGKSITGGRFDLIIADDPESDKSVITDHVRKHTRSWFRTTIQELLEPWGEFLVIGTRKHNDDLYAHLKNDRTVNVVETKALYRWRCRTCKTDLTHQAQPVCAEHPQLRAEMIGDVPKHEWVLDDYGKIIGVRVLDQNLPKVLWPEVWPLEALLRKRESMTSVLFARENQNDVISDENAVFQKEWLDKAKERGLRMPCWRTSADVPGDWVVIQAVDPAFVDDEKKAQDADADYFVMVTVAVNLHNWHRRILRCWRGRGRQPSMYIAHIRSMAAPFQQPSDTHPMGALKWIVVENNSFGKFYELGLRRDTDLPLVPHSTTIKKADPFTGVDAMAALYENDMISWCRRPPREGATLSERRDYENQEQFLDTMYGELYGIGSEAHDDTVMACYLAEVAIRRLRRSIEKAAQGLRPAPTRRETTAKPLPPPSTGTSDDAPLPSELAAAGEPPATGTAVSAPTQEGDDLARQNPPRPAPVRPNPVRPSSPDVPMTPVERVLAAVRQGTMPACTREEWPQVKQALAAFATQCMTTGDFAVGQRTFSEAARLSGLHEVPLPSRPAAQGKHEQPEDAPLSRSVDWYAKNRGR